MGALMLLPPDEYPQHDEHWLEVARQYEEATGQTVVNPRNLQPRTLLDIDEDWLKSRRIYQGWRKFFGDLDKRPKDMQ